MVPLVTPAPASGPAAPQYPALHELPPLSTAQTPPSASRCPFSRVQDAIARTLIVSHNGEGEARIGSSFLIPQFARNIFHSCAQLFRAEPPADHERRILPKVDYDLHLPKFIASLPFNPLGALRDVFTRFGPDVELIAPNAGRIRFHTDPDVLKFAFHATDGKQDLYDKGRSMVRGARPIFGSDNVIIGDGEAARTRRQAFAPQFGRTRFEQRDLMEQMQRIVSACADELAEEIRHAPGETMTVDLDHEFTIVTMRVFLSVFFGIESYSRSDLEPINNALRTAVNSIPKEAANFLPLSLETIGSVFPPLARLSAAGETLDAFADELMDIARARAEPRGDLLDVLVHARDSASGEPLDRELLREEILTLLVTGHDTTARTLAFGCGSLVLNPSAYTRALAEIDGDRRVFTSASELSEALPYLVCARDEALRLYAPIYWIPRHAVADHEIPTAQGPLFVPRNTELILSPYFMQRREDLFGTARTGFPANIYAPERWEEANLKQRGLTRNDLKLYSFGAGARVCLGSHFFNPEYLLVAREYLARFSFDPLYRDIEEGVFGAFTIQREGGIPVRASLRR